MDRWGCRTASRPSTRCARTGASRNRRAHADRRRHTLSSTRAIDVRFPCVSASSRSDRTPAYGRAGRGPAIGDGAPSSATLVDQDHSDRVHRSIPGSSRAVGACCCSSTTAANSGLEAVGGVVTDDAERRSVAGSGRRLRVVRQRVQVALNVRGRAQTVDEKPFAPCEQPAFWRRCVGDQRGRARRSASTTLGVHSLPV